MAHLNTTDLKQYLKKLRKNLLILQERKAKYAGSAPLALLNQLDDYNKAIDLTKDTLIGDLELEELEQALKPLILEIDSSPAQQATLKISPPPDPLHPPEIRGFVGREEELSYFMAKLKNTNLALITGMVGCGKTALAATLAETWQVKQLMGLAETSSVSSPQAVLKQIRRKIFWYAFYQDEGVLGLAYALAGFLYHNGQPALWEMLESARLTNTAPPDPTNLFNYVFQMIRNKGYLLCLDDVQFVHGDSLLNLFVNHVTDILNKNEVHLILTAWEKPAYVPQIYRPILGLSQNDTTHLLKSRGLTLNNELNAEVYKLTEGNPKLLNLTILILQKAKNISRTLKNLAQSDDIEYYLLEQIDTTLSETQRNTLIAIAVLLGCPAKRATIEAVSDQRRLKRTILTLSNRYLLTVYDDYDDDKEEELYQTHTIIRIFYYDFPSKHELKKLHTLAAQFYQEEEDFLRTARHYERAGQHQTAVNLLTTHFWPLMNQGQIQLLQRMLKRLLKQTLTELQSIKATLALADIYQKTGEFTTAKEHYQQSLNLLTTSVPSIDKQLLTAKACKGMAENILFNDITEALQWIEQGLTALETADQEEKINLLLLKSWLQIGQAHYQTARQTIEEALQTIPSQRGWLRIRALKQLSIIYHQLGDYEQAIQLATQALTLAEHYHDYFEMVKLLNNLGIFKREKGDIIAAVSTYKQALTLAEDLGLIQERLTIEGNLGNLQIKLGNYQEAEHYFLRQQKMAEEKDMKRYKVGAMVNLGQLYVQQKKFNKANNYLKDTLTIAPQVGLKDWLPYIYCYLALIDLAKNKISTALQHANQALQIAQEFKLPIEEGIAWRVLGQIQLANKEPIVALKSFAKSSALLTDKSPYELAQTQLEWGRYLISTPQLEQGQQLLQAARATFKQTGAKVDLATTEALLKTIDKG